MKSNQEKMKEYLISYNQIKSVGLLEDLKTESSKLSRCAEINNAFNESLERDEIYKLISSEEKILAHKNSPLLEKILALKSKYFDLLKKYHIYNIAYIESGEYDYYDELNDLEEQIETIQNIIKETIKQRLINSKLQLEQIAWQGLIKQESLLFNNQNNTITKYINKFNKKYGYIPEAELLIPHLGIFHNTNGQITFKSPNIVGNLILTANRYSCYWVEKLKNHEDVGKYFNENLPDNDFNDQYNILNIKCVLNLRKVIDLYQALVSENILEQDKKSECLFYLLFADLNLYNLTNEINKYKEKILFDIDNINFNDLSNVVSKFGNGNDVIHLLSLIYIHQEYVKDNIVKYSDTYIKIKRNINELCIKLKNKKFLDSLDSEDDNEEKTTISDVDLMSGSEFEHFVADLFTKMGYKTYVTKASNDQGIDVIAENSEIKVAIQAKCYSGIVGNHAIMEAVGGMKYYKANKCMVVTNRNFTKSAIELARANNVELWNRKTLEEKIHEYM